MEEIHQLVIERAIKIQQIPAPTFSEQKRAAFVAQEFRSEGLQDVSIDPIGNVYGRLPGGNPTGAPVLVCAHSDTVFPAETDLAIRKENGKIFGPGLGDNSTGVAGLFGLLWSLQARKSQLPVDLWLVANVCEEGLGDLKGIRAVVNRFKDQPKGYIILEGMSLGHVYYRGLAVRRYRITVETPGGHSWANFGSPSAIHEIAKLITQITSLPIPKKPATTYNVGIVSGGKSVNTIAQQAEILVDLRSESAETLKDLYGRVEALLDSASQGEVKVRREIVGDRPGGEISPEHPLVRLAVKSLEAQGMTANLRIGSTDANVPLSLGLPTVCVGLTTGGGAHTTEEYINTGPIQQGLAQLGDLVVRACQL